MPQSQQLDQVQIDEINLDSITVVDRDVCSCVAVSARQPIFLYRSKTDGVLSISNVFQNQVFQIHQKLYNQDDISSNENSRKLLIRGAGENCDIAFSTFLYFENIIQSQNIEIDCFRVKKMMKVENISRLDVYFLYRNQQLSEFLKQSSIEISCNRYPFTISEARSEFEDSLKLSCLCMTYYVDETGNLPRKESVMSHMTILGFLLGMRLIPLGYNKINSVESTLIECHYSLNPLYVLATKDNIHPPLLFPRLPKFCTTFTSVLSLLINNEGELSQDFKKAIYGALSRIWTLPLQLVDFYPVYVASALELLMTKYWEDNDTDSVRYLPNADYHRIADPYIQGIRTKLFLHFGHEYCSKINQVYGKLHNVNNMGEFDKTEYKLKKIGIELSESENLLFDMRNKIIHEYAFVDERLQSSFINSLNSWVSLFNRTLLILLGYNGAYIDYSDKTGRLERNVSEPSGVDRQ